MGTRGLSYFYPSEKTDEQPILCVYRQYDSYPEGHGIDLAEFLEPFTLVNGIPVGDTRKLANGMGCLAAQFVAHFKKEAGGFYVEPAILNQACGQEYEYHVFADKVVVYANEYPENNKLFEGTWAELKDFCQSKFDFVESSDGSKYYRVRTAKSGKMYCDCKEFEVRGSCRHINEVTAQRKVA